MESRFIPIQAVCSECIGLRRRWVGVHTNPNFCCLARFAHAESFRRMDCGERGPSQHGLCPAAIHLSPQPHRLSRERHVVIPSLEAGVAYAIIVFMVGFGLGWLRVTLIVPRLSETDAVLLETPIMLAVSWMASHWCAARFQVPTHADARFLMGSIAFGVLMLAELGVSVVVLGRSAAQHFASYRSVAGVIGLAAQIAFAGSPFVQTRRD